MFKDIKKLKDQGKEIGAQTGRPTSMLGMLKDTPNQLHQATAAVDDAMALQAEMQKQQQLLATGAVGRATIKNFTDTGTLVNFNPQVVLDLEVAVDGQTPYDRAAQHRGAADLPRAACRPGTTIGVRVDPGDPSSIAIDWAQA